ncbi:hypothetical protein KGF57_003352 [Candida theae]|uniref:PH-response regulator protein palH/RIM21 n=1 Tax=Candida theae TaxID=1198502 RepID=A0AAD5BDQ1_9ASCO|nr:uncharacterized protein KGF57_003352 [Candida theae]KAI5957657.1 hypothetical protein KGF57_003352 [Candida theae]
MTSQYSLQDGFSYKFSTSPYNERDNGDTFIALLFTLCGSCVSSWMLSLLLYLTQKHRKKPWLAQVTTIFYAIFTSVLLDRLTKAAEVEYYDDNLDIINLNYKLYDNNVYRILTILTQAFTMSSWFQIIQRLVRVKYKFATLIINFIIMGAYIAVYVYFQVQFTTRDYINQEFENFSLYYRWDIACTALRLVVIFWFLGVLAYYTTIVKNPRKICYSRKLLPLAILVWFFFVLNIVLNILYISLFRKRWLVRTWLVLIPCLIDVILLTIIWEWIYNIWILEKRCELMNVLGRRISYEDIVSFKNNDSARKAINLGNFVDWIISKFTGQTTINHVEERSDDSLKEYFTSTNSEGSEERAMMSRTQDRDSNQGETHPIPNYHETSIPLHHVRHNSSGGARITQADGIDPSPISGHESERNSQIFTGNNDNFDDEYVNDYEMWSDDDGGLSMNGSGGHRNVGMS